MGMSMSGATTVTITTELTLKPVQKVKLRRALKLYAELAQQEKALKLAKDKAKADVRVIREELGVERLEFEGYKTTNVLNLRSKLDKKLYVELGGSLEVLNNAIVIAPGRAYERISLPGEVEREGGE